MGDCLPKNGSRHDMGGQVVAFFDYSRLPILFALRYTFNMAEIGVLGGTFDPPHEGHLTLARAARQQWGLERVLWVLTPAPPHKRGQRLTPLEHRLAMVQLALQGEPAFELSRVDIDRPPPHYAVDTLRLLARQYPAAGLIYLMGADSLRDLPLWHRAAEFVASCARVAVLPRPGVDLDLNVLEQRLPGLRAKVRWLEAPPMAVSSSEIRRRLAQGQTVEGLLPPAVAAYIVQHGLYRSDGQRPAPTNR